MMIKNLKHEPEMKVCVDVSREWDGKKVSEELVQKMSKKVKKPRFILLFTTIHYKREFKSILSGIREAFPEALLIGGTVAGFMTNDGCFTRGVTTFSLEYQKMDIAIGVGHNTKRNPHKAARECAEMIEKGLKYSKYENKFLVNIISAPLIPELPLIGKVNNVKSRLLGKFLSYVGMEMASYLGTGIAKESDILEKLALSMPEFYIIGGSSVDDGRMLSNYQFIGDSVSTNSIVALGCCIKAPICFEKKITVHQTNKKFKITETAFGNRIITKIEGIPAKEFFLKNVLGFSEELFKDLGPFYYKTSDYFPITFEENKERVLGVGCFFGDHILLSHKMAGKNAILCSVTGKEIIDSFRSIFNKKIKSPFMLSFSSIIHVFILGSKIFEIKKIVDKHVGDTPYLIVQPMVENIKLPNQNPSVRVYSFNSLTLNMKGA